jgi:hypothetical protein
MWSTKPTAKKTRMPRKIRISFVSRIADLGVREFYRSA